MNWAQLYESLGQQLKDGVDLPWWQDAFVGIYKAFFEEDRWQFYLDGVLKLGNHDLDGLGKLLAEVEALVGDNVKVTVTVSADMSTLPESVKKYA